MNWISLSLTLLLLQTPATRQAAPQTRPEDRASITGFVIKMGTSEPLGKAVVVLTGGTGRNASLTATTTSGGQFVFQNLDPGTYRLSATRNGYVRSEYGARSPNRPGLPITLTPGQKMTQLVIPLMTAGTITGRVYDRDGEPLANVTVQALKYSYQDGQRVLNPTQLARTNDLGEYRLFWLNPGQYFVSATYNEGARGLLAAAGGGRGAFGIGPRRPHCSIADAPWRCRRRVRRRIHSGLLSRYHGRSIGRARRSSGRCHFQWRRSHGCGSSHPAHSRPGPQRSEWTACSECQRDAGSPATTRIRRGDDRKLPQPQYRRAGYF